MVAWSRPSGSWLAGCSGGASCCKMSQAQDVLLFGLGPLRNRFLPGRVREMCILSCQASRGSPWLLSCGFLLISDSWTLGLFFLVGSLLFPWSFWRFCVLAIASCLPCDTSSAYLPRRGSVQVLAAAGHCRAPEPPSRRAGHRPIGMGWFSVVFCDLGVGLVGVLEPCRKRRPTTGSPTHVMQMLPSVVNIPTKSPCHRLKHLLSPAAQLHMRALQVPISQR